MMSLIHCLKSTAEPDPSEEWRSAISANLPLPSSADRVGSERERADSTIAINEITCFTADMDQSNLLWLPCLVICPAGRVMCSPGGVMCPVGRVMWSPGWVESVPGQGSARPAGVAMYPARAVRARSRGCFLPGKRDLQDLTDLSDLSDIQDRLTPCQAIQHNTLSNNTAKHPVKPKALLQSIKDNRTKRRIQQFGVPNLTHQSSISSARAPFGTATLPTGTSVASPRG